MATGSGRETTVNVDTSLRYFIKGWLLLVVALNLAACVAILSAPTMHDVYGLLGGTGHIGGFLSPEILVVNLLLIGPAYLAHFWCRRRDMRR